MSQKFGHISAETHAGKVRVSLDGRDVTCRCMEADDVKGLVRLLCVDSERHDWRYSQGQSDHLMPDADDRVCSYVVRGDVQVVPIT